MPKTWVYIFALVLPLLFRLVLQYTPLLDTLWYRGYPDAYQFLANLSVNAVFLTYIGSYAMPVFVVTIASYWLFDADDDAISSQFLLLPLAYVPFSVIVTMIANMQVDLSLLYIHPLVIIPAGYVYVLLWAVLIWLLEKAGLVN